MRRGAIAALAAIVTVVGLLVAPSVVDPRALQIEQLSQPQEEPEVASFGAVDDGHILAEVPFSVTATWPNPTLLADCLAGGWESFGFRNQGRCIQFVLLGRDSR